MRIVAWPLVACALVAASLSAAADSGSAFTVGALRRDGIVIPFATFDGRRWSAHWPEPSDDLTVPITVDAIPKGWWGPTMPLADWQVWTSAGARAVHVVQPDWVDIFCSRQIGLRTDYKPRDVAPPRSVQPYPKDGLAVAPPRPVDVIDIVNPESAEARGLMPQLLSVFNQAERARAKTDGNPVQRRAREGIQPTIEAVYAVGTTERLYYVESSRRYRLLGQSVDDCEALAYGQGWFVRNATGVYPIAMNVDLLTCDRAGATYMLPLGALRVRGRLFWLAQYSGVDGEFVVIFEVKPKGIEIALQVAGGSC
jgi:hypothetical protein